MPKSTAAGLCTGCRKCGEDAKKARCTWFKLELSTMIASVATFGAALDGCAAAASAIAPLHAVPHGGSVVGAFTSGGVVAGTARTAEELPLPA